MYTYLDNQAELVPQGIKFSKGQASRIFPSWYEAMTTLTNHPTGVHFAMDAHKHLK